MQGILSRNCFSTSTYPASSSFPRWKERFPPLSPVWFAGYPYGLPLVGYMASKLAGAFVEASQQAAQHHQVGSGGDGLGNVS